MCLWTAEYNQGHGGLDYGAAHKGHHDSSSDLNRQLSLNLSSAQSMKSIEYQRILGGQNKTTTGSDTLAIMTFQEFLVKLPTELTAPFLGEPIDELYEVFLHVREMTTTAINVHARSSTLPEMTSKDFLAKEGVITEGEKDSSPTLGADPVVLPQQNVPQQAPDQQLAPGDAMHQKEHIGGVEKVNESGEESYVEFTGYAMNTGPLSCQTKQSLQQQQVTETEKEILASNHSRQMLNDAMHVSGITVDAEKNDTTIRFINKTDTKKKSKIKHKKFERDINLASISEYFGKPLDDAAKSFNISRSTFKRKCRDHGVNRWPSAKRRIIENTFSKLSTANEGEPSRKEDPANVAQSSQKMNGVTVKALYNGVSIRFELSDSSGIVELEDNVIERLKLDRKMFSIKYKDDDGDWVLIACDKDVQKCMEISRSLENTTIKMLIDLPIHHCAP